MAKANKFIIMVSGCGGKSQLQVTYVDDRNSRESKLKYSFPTKAAAQEAVDKLIKTNAYRSTTFVVAEIVTVCKRGDYDWTDGAAMPDEVRNPND